MFCISFYKLLALTVTAGFKYYQFSKGTLPTIHFDVKSVGLLYEIIILHGGLVLLRSENAHKIVIQEWLIIT